MVGVGGHWHDGTRNSAMDRAFSAAVKTPHGPRSMLLVNRLFQARSDATVAIRSLFGDRPGQTAREFAVSLPAETSEPVGIAGGASTGKFGLTWPSLGRRWRASWPTAPPRPTVTL
jgi:hypothetical protein